MSVLAASASVLAVVDCVRPSAVPVLLAVLGARGHDLVMLVPAGDAPCCNAPWLVGVLVAICKLVGVVG